MQPAYAARSVVGCRRTMEDAFACVPNLVVAPRAWEDGLPHEPDLLPPLDSYTARGSQALRALEHMLHEQAQAAEGDGGPATPAGQALHFFAVYDGHGGADVASYCARRLHELLRSILSSSSAWNCPAGEPEAATAGSADTPPTQVEGGAQPVQGHPQLQHHQLQQLNQQQRGQQLLPQKRGSCMADSAHDDSTVEEGSPDRNGRCPSVRRQKGLERGEAEGPSGPTGQRVGATGEQGELQQRELGSEQQEEEEEERPPANDGGGEVSGLPVLALPAGSVESALVQAFLEVDEAVRRETPSGRMGATAVVALLSSEHMWVANAGDCRAVLCRTCDATGATAAAGAGAGATADGPESVAEAEAKEGRGPDGPGAIAAADKSSVGTAGVTAVELSVDHKAGREDEVARIEAAGGYVEWGSVMGELAVARALGDHNLRPYVIPHPEVTRVRHTQRDALLLLASDGLWDVFSSEEAAAFGMASYVKELGKGTAPASACHQVATALVSAALERGSRDNTTVLVVDVRMAAGA